MGVYIKGMEMPTYDGVFPCRLRVENGVVKLEIDYIITAFMDERKVYPLVPIPPHGRLIDADALEDNNITYYAIPVLANVTDAELVIRMKDLDEAPTIIPADPAEEGE